MNIPTRVAAILAAAGLAATPVAVFEGAKYFGYLDPVGIPTACMGHTGGIVVGRRYSPDECMDFLLADLVKHGRDIDRCITVDVPNESRAAFTSFAFNVGAAKFCGSTLARKLNAGDLRGACAELSRWTYAGKRQLPGLITRRASERAMCERGLA